MEDVKDPNESVEQATEAPVEQPSQATEITDTPIVQPSQEPKPVERVERQVPISVVLEERKKRQELQRELAQARAGNQTSHYDQNDLEQVMQHPFVQDLIMKDAKRKLTDYTSDLMGKYPTIPEAVKKAILKNPRGYINEDTQDIETAKLDILEYVESLAAETEIAQAPVQKGFPVATTNLPAAESATAGINEVSKLLEKPVDEMTPEEHQVLEEYRKRLKK